MSTISLDLERRFEQRWAARFSRPEQAAKVRGEPIDALLKARERSAKLNQRTRGLPQPLSLPPRKLPALEPPRVRGSDELRRQGCF